VGDRRDIECDGDVHLTEAALWRVRLTEAGLRTIPEFELWLQKPGNAAAWEQVSISWSFFGEVAHEPEMIEAREAALRDIKRAGTSERRAPHKRWLVGAAAAILVAGFYGWGSYVWVNRPDDYQTAAGERRVVTLSDGSKLSLDADSEVTVRYTRNARTLHLLRGQARFDVFHDKHRPFAVVAGNQEVIATGTAFNIDMSGSKVFVTLIEGHVVVLNDGKTSEAVRRASPLWPKSVELRAGQQLAALPSAPPEIAPVNIQQVTAWMNGQIMADNESLSSVVARVNRYDNTTIVIDDPQIAAMKISGVFNAGDVAGFIEIVTHYLPVRAIPQASNTVLLKSDPKKNDAM
jgi:transmembrane sensor